MLHLEIRRRPPAWLGWSCCVAAVILFGALRLVVFHNAIMPLTYALPMLICLFTLDKRMLWSMGAVFVVFAAVKIFWIMPPDAMAPGLDWAVFGAQLLNIAVAGAIVHAVINLRAALEQRQLQLEHANDAIVRQNAELESQSEELAQQNEELRSQGEELGQQSEELQGQTEDLQALNEELARRERVLQQLLQATTGGTGSDVVGKVCEVGLHLMERRIGGAAVLQPDGKDLVIIAHAGFAAAQRNRWPLSKSLAEVVMTQRRTAAISDLALRPDLIIPQPPEGPSFRSALAAPLRAGNAVSGTIEFYSTESKPWSKDEFRLAEWLADQAGVVLEMLRLRQELENARRAAEGANSAKDEFLAVLSHELRTPLNPALMAVSMMMKDGSLPEGACTMAGIARRNLELEAKLIDDMLDVTRIARRKLVLEKKAVDGIAVLRQAIEICRSDAATKNLELTAKEFDGPVIVNADPARLQQIFWNVIKNAIKFTPNYGTVDISGRAMDRGFEVIVRDNGVGISPALLPRIFDAFEQGGINTTRRFGGLGLGLAICRGLVELHGGTITAESAGEGRGAVFTVVLPRADARVPEGVLEKRLLQRFPRSLRILLIEDHESSADVTALFLQSLGHTVEGVQTAQAARIAYERAAFDMIISDIGLPDGNGCELLGELLRIRRTPAIAMSGYGMEHDLRRSEQAGFLEHVTKPVDLQRLEAAIKKAAEVWGSPAMKAAV